MSNGQPRIYGLSISKPGWSLLRHMAQITIKKIKTKTEPRKYDTKKQQLTATLIASGVPTERARESSAVSPMRRVALQIASRPHKQQQSRDPSPDTTGFDVLLLLAPPVSNLYKSRRFLYSRNPCLFTQRGAMRSGTSVINAY